MNATGDRRARMATFGVAIAAAVVATAMNRVQVARADSTPIERESVVAPTTVEVIAFG